MISWLKSKEKKKASITITALGGIDRAGEQIVTYLKPLNHEYC